MSSNIVKRQLVIVGNGKETTGQEWDEIRSNLMKVLRIIKRYLLLLSDLGKGSRMSMAILSSGERI